MVAGPISQPPTPVVGGKRSFTRFLLVVLIAAIIVAGVVTVLVSALFIGPAFVVTKKSFAPYSTPVSQNSNSPSSLTVADTNGGITITPWSQAYLMINGTITARGFGANPDKITLIESNSSGDIVFQVKFPDSTFFVLTSYAVDINVFVPASTRFNVVQAVTMNGDVHISGTSASTVTLTDTNGKISASAITADSLTLADNNGSIDFTCSCGSVTATTTNGAITANLTVLSSTGSYILTSTNGSIDLKLPATGNFEITASTTNGSVSSTGLVPQVSNHIPLTFGTGTAVVTATTTNGSITVTGI